MKGSWTSPVLSLNSEAGLTCPAIAKLLLHLNMHPHTVITSLTLSSPTTFAIYALLV